MNGSAQYRRFKRWLLTSAAGCGLLVLYRLRHTVRAGIPRGWRYWRWLFAEREVGNYSYALTPESKTSLAVLVDRVCGLDRGAAVKYIDEFDHGGTAAALAGAIDEATEKSPFRWSQNVNCTLEQRLIYYLLVRGLKPRLVFQSGTSRGVGAALIAAALIQNAVEGYRGRLISTDIDPEQGYGITEPWRQWVDFKVGDSVAVLQALRDSVDLYIHDTTGGDQAWREFGALESHINERTVVLSTWHTDITQEVARRWRRAYCVWKDQPECHWYRGATMAIIGPDGDDQLAREK